MEQGHLKDGRILCFVARDRIAVMSHPCSEKLWRHGDHRQDCCHCCLLGVCREAQVRPSVTGGDETGINWKIRNYNQIGGEWERSNTGTENLWHHHSWWNSKTHWERPRANWHALNKGLNWRPVWVFTPLQLQTESIHYPRSRHTVLMERTHHNPGSHCPGILY